MNHLRGQCFQNKSYACFRSIAIPFTLSIVAGADRIGAPDGDGFSLVFYRRLPEHLEGVRARPLFVKFHVKGVYVKQGEPTFSEGLSHDIEVAPNVTWLRDLYRFVSTRGGCLPAFKLNQVRLK